MNAQSPIVADTGLALLRAPFPANQISKLPKPTKKQTEDVRADFKKGVRCKICGTWHHPDVVHLDYVGHAALTDRLLDADPMWSWEPVAFGPNGLPAVDGNGGMWIKLTVCGVTRLGYGSADGKSGGDAVKELIGDALRNAAMRFGAALDLWHKGDLHADEEETPAPKQQAAASARIGDDDRDVLMTMLEKSGADTRAFCQHFGIGALPELPAARLGEATALLNKKLSKKAAPQRAQAPATDIIDDEIPY